MIEHPEKLRIEYEDNNCSIMFALDGQDYIYVKNLLVRAQAGEIKMEEIFGLIRDMSGFLLRRYTQTKKERLQNGKSND